MTSTQIIAEANEEAMVVGASDINLERRLRRKVLRDFETAVGECAWRRKSLTPIYTVVGIREYDLPTDFVKMLTAPKLYDSAGDLVSTLQYVGEDPDLISAGEADAEQGLPAGFSLVRLTGSVTRLERIWFNKIPDAIYTLRSSYVSRVPVADEVTEIDFDDFIPGEIQWALVEGLKIEIYRGRVSIRDNRLQESKDAWSQYVEIAKELREPAQRVENRKFRMGPL